MIKSMLAHLEEKRARPDGLDELFTQVSAFGHLHLWQCDGPFHRGKWSCRIELYTDNPAVKAHVDNKGFDDTPQAAIRAALKRLNG